ncbi:unnamed protein product [Caenorhabditis sp. 36 PRJEB53466]|nr:unnamed protein product [Caenorhabditis sp. 36 PRJEB53466]
MALLKRSAPRTAPAKESSAKKAKKEKPVRSDRAGSSSDSESEESEPESVHESEEELFEFSDDSSDDSESEDESEEQLTLQKYIPVVLRDTPKVTPKRRIIKMDDREKFTVIQTIGKGTFGKVVMVTNRMGERKALKIFRGRYSEVNQSSKAERMMLWRLRTATHRNLATAYKVGQLVTCIAGHTQIIIIMPLLGPSLFDVMERSRRVNYDNEYSFPVDDIIAFGSQMIAALKKLEELNIVHLDVKPANVFFSNPDLEVSLQAVKDGLFFTHCSDLRIKIGDFGSAEIISEDDEEEEAYEVQPRFYRAPEIFLGLPFTTTSDVWSIGCILCEIYTGCLLFDDVSDRPPLVSQYFMMKAVLQQEPTQEMLEEAEENRDDRYLEICSGQEWEKDIGPFPLLKERIREGETQAKVPELFDFIEFLLEFDPSDRPTFTDASSHSIFD